MEWEGLICFGAITMAIAALFLHLQSLCSFAAYEMKIFQNLPFLVGPFLILCKAQWPTYDQSIISYIIYFILLDLDIKSTGSKFE